MHMAVVEPLFPELLLGIIPLKMIVNRLTYNHMYATMNQMVTVLNLIILNKKLHLRGADVIQPWMATAATPRHCLGLGLGVRAKG